MNLGVNLPVARRRGRTIPQLLAHAFNQARIGGRKSGIELKGAGRSFKTIILILTFDSSIDVTAAPLNAGGHDEQQAPEQ